MKFMTKIIKVIVLEQFCQVSKIIKNKCLWHKYFFIRHKCCLFAKFQSTKSQNQSLLYVFKISRNECKMSHPQNYFWCFYNLAECHKRHTTRTLQGSNICFCSNYEFILNLRIRDNILRKPWNGKKPYRGEFNLLWVVDCNLLIECNCLFSCVM